MPLNNVPTQTPKTPMAMLRLALAIAIPLSTLAAADQRGPGSVLPRYAWLAAGRFRPHIEPKHTCQKDRPIPHKPPRAANRSDDPPHLVAAAPTGRPLGGGGRPLGRSAGFARGPGRDRVGSLMRLTGLAAAGACEGVWGAAIRSSPEARRVVSTSPVKQSIQSLQMGPPAPTQQHKQCAHQHVPLPVWANLRDSPKGSQACGSSTDRVQSGQVRVWV